LSKQVFKISLEKDLIEVKETQPRPNAFICWWLCWFRIRLLVCAQLKSTNYLIYDVVDDIFICQINKKKKKLKRRRRRQRQGYVSNYVWCNKHLLNFPP
jgi:hypothetical protein